MADAVVDAATENGNPEMEAVGKLVLNIELIEAQSGRRLIGQEALAGKVLGLLIGPHWLPVPLQQTLASFAESAVELQTEGKPVAFVYVPTDRDDNLISMLRNYGQMSQIDGRPDPESFSEILQSLPEGWLAVPFTDSESRSVLIQRCSSSIFSLAFVGEGGQINTKEGLRLLEKWGSDGFPFTDQRIEELQQETAQRASKQSLASLLVSADRDYVIRNDGSQVKVESLEGKTVALYFSAHWCPPCQRFTPVLADIYNQLKSRNDDFEVVFISWDKDQTSFEKYHNEMPWLALPFADSKTKKILSRWFEVEGIPSFIILDTNGKTLNTEGAELIFKHGLEAYPFTAERLAELDAEEEARRAAQTLESLLVTEERDFVISPDGQEVKVSSIKGKTVGLYFSAHWCPPCRNFTPKLISAYNELHQKGKDFEIVFISSDRDEEAFKSYYGSMPWLALPFSDRQSKSTLSSYFDIQGIPSLVILGPDGKTVAREGRELVSQHGSDGFPFTEAHLSELRRAQDEVANKLPKEIQYAGHPEHPLILSDNAYSGQAYVCDKCDEQGSGWVYHCDKCSYDLHPSCSQTDPLEHQPSEDQAEANVTHPSEDEKPGFICEGDVCRRV
ncbi:hypothetical protein O6H91_04G017400 [Diphasiastrum complanatum]|uniref:Uncharacterized protein n=1 Tax=Diphasiastrum complanatum TaxID=34168 RepID=A0ACC2DUU4_DIPCM|nr:hypothetical protein O6H91_04G017400 [Diphasiastrum complanatum]